MAYKQEQCPLCGKNMTAIETYPGRGELYCDHCDLTIGGNDAKTLEELIALMDGSEYRQLKAENAKLRELISEPSKCDSCEAMLDCDECLRADVSHKRVRSLEAENAKLLELVRDVFGAYKGAVEMFPSSYTKNVMEMAVMDISDRMCELGVEVDE